MSRQIFYTISEKELNLWLQLAALKGSRTVAPSNKDIELIADNTIRQAKETHELVPVNG